MAEQLRHFYDGRIVRSIARDLRRVYTRFDTADFSRECLAALDELSLTERAAHIAEVMRRHLPKNAQKAIELLIDSLGPPLVSSEAFGMEPFRYLPHVLFVARYGLDHFETSMRAQYELTQRFSAESSIRSFLIRYPEETYERLVEWSSDPSVHVRRLVSEGSRPRLPWAQRLRQFQKDPRPVIDLLERLKDDPERYVQRSVANNVNDIAKDHPDLAVEVCRRWLEQPTAERRWIVNHALRSLIKRGHRGAMKLLGYSARVRVEIAAVRVPKRVRLGQTLRISFDVVNTSRAGQEILVDYAIDFVKANGGRSAKVFKLRRMFLPAGERTTLQTRTSFAAMTTRKHYRGTHSARVLVNARSFPLGEFEVV